MSIEKAIEILGELQEVAVDYDGYREAKDLMDIVDELSEFANKALEELNQEELTTSQAAGLLGVPRPYLIKLLNDGLIQYHKAGTHRRVRRGDVDAYRRMWDAERHGLFHELAPVSEEPCDQKTSVKH